MTKLFLLFTFLILSCKLFAYTDEELGQEIKLLLTRIQERHVNPRTIDASFALSVHENFLEYLDPNKLFFSKEDELTLEASLPNLLTDLKEGNITYFKTVRELFQLRLQAFKLQSNQFYSSEIASTFKAIETFMEERPAASNQQVYWSRFLGMNFFSEMLDLLEDTDTEFHKDSLNVWSLKTRNSLKKRSDDSIQEMMESEKLGVLFLNAIAQAFDPHTFFFSPSTKTMFEEELTSERERYGFDLEFDLNNKTIISDIVPGSPAWLSNEIHPGDEILSLNFIGEKKIMFDGTIQTFNEGVKSFSTVKTKEIKLVLKSKDNFTKEVNLFKSKIYSDNDIIKNAILEAEHKIGYISLPDFYSNNTDQTALGCANDLAKCLIKLKKDSIAGLILDFRGNGGGSLKEAVDIVGIFINNGPILAVEYKGKEIVVLKDFNYGAIYTGPLMIMIDSESASASEIVASSLQDYNRALIFGSPSFGKASSQGIFSLDPRIMDLTMGLVEEDPNLAYANITMGKLYRITGKWNQGIGTQPDVLWKLNLANDYTESERDYRNVIAFDSLPKKMKFQPLPKLKSGILNTASQKRIQTDSLFVKYANLTAKFNQLLEKSESGEISLNSELKLRNEWMKLVQDSKKIRIETPCNFKSSNNQFDLTLFKTDEILNRYNQLFLKKLEQDIQLREGVNVMLDLINEHP